MAQCSLCIFIVKKPLNILYIYTILSICAIDTVKYAAFFIYFARNPIHGFEGKTSTGKEFNVVFVDNTIKLYDGVQEGQCVRILAALIKGSVVRVLLRTEYYYVRN